MAAHLRRRIAAFLNLRRASFGAFTSPHKQRSCLVTLEYWWVCFKTSTVSLITALWLWDGSSCGAVFFDEEDSLCFACLNSYVSLLLWEVWICLIRAFCSQLPVQLQALCSHPAEAIRRSQGCQVACEHFKDDRGFWSCSPYWWQGSCLVVQASEW